MARPLSQSTGAAKPKKKSKPKPKLPPKVAPIVKQVTKAVTPVVQQAQPIKGTAHAKVGAKARANVGKGKPAAKAPSSVERAVQLGLQTGLTLAGKHYVPTPKQHAEIMRRARKNRGAAMRMLAHGFDTYSNLDAVGAVAGKDHKHSAVIATANPSLRGGANAVKVGAATGVAAYHDPLGVAGKTLKGGVEIVKAAPSGIVDALLHPGDVPGSIKKDYERRYGKSFDQTVKRIRKEGAAPELLDAAALATAGGTTVGRIGVNAARASGRSFVVRARPAVQVAGGVAHEQELAGTVGRLAAQRVGDKLRAAKTERVRKKMDRDVPQKVDAVHAEAVRQGNVVQLRPLKLSRTQAKMVAKTKSRGVHRMKAEQHRRVDASARRQLTRLNKHERRAFFYIASGLAPAERVGFVKALEERMRGIAAVRAETGEPLGLTRHTDELRNIPKIDFDKIDFGKVKAAYAELKDDAIRIGREDPSLNAAQRLQRRYSQQAETLGLRRGEVEPEGHAGVPGMRYGEESLGQFIRRVQSEADKRGLERPLYVPSERYALDLHPDYSSRAAGGARAAATSRAYTGANFREGLQDTTPEAFLTGLSRNIKRKHNWPLVLKFKDDHAIGGFEGSASAVRQEMSDRGIDPQSYVLWNPKIMRDQMRRHEQPKDVDGLEAADIAETTASDMLRSTHRAATDALDKDDPMIHDSGWVAIPKKAWKEIEDSTKPSGALGRSWDIFKGKNSRLLLGPNPVWLQFQVASNALIAGFATKGALPANMIAAQRWYKRLDPEVRDEIDGLLGASSHDVQHQTHLGATTSNAMVGTWRAFKDLPVWDAKVKGRGPSVRQLNPIEAMFAMDRKQTAAFKRAVLYNQVKRRAFQRMGEHMTAAEQAQARIVSILGKHPDNLEEAMRAIAKDPKALERAADAVNDLMGDYTTFTARERKILNRSVMFYGFLRFSLKLLFYTMPFKHPGATAIIGKLGQMQRDEIEELLGGHTMPWSFGKLYFVDGDKLKAVDLGRANPAINMLVQAASSGNPGGIVASALPPAAGALLDQAYGKKLYFDRQFRVDGGTGYKPQKFGDVGLADRGEIYLDTLGGMAFPYRVAETLTQEGAQGDDSTLWDPEPTVYKDEEYLKDVRQQIRRDRQTESLATELVPFIPVRSFDREINLDRALREQEEAAPPAKKKRSRPSGSYMSSGSGGGGYMK